MPASAGVAFVDLSAQHAEIRPELEAAVAGVLGRGDFILGDGVAQFEEEMAAYCGVAHGVGVDSGTSALELSLRAVGVGPDDEVITAANSFIASALAVVHVGAEPVLVDVDPDTKNMDPELLERAITTRTKAIMPVHLYGYPADLGPIRELAERHDLAVVEDASQAHGARYRDVRVGAMGDVGAFSLYPAKNLGALGDAGIVVTDDPDIAHRLRLLRNYGSVEKYHHETVGYNRRLDTLQAAVLSIKLRHLDAWNDARRHWAGMYDKLLGHLSDELITPTVGAEVEPVYHLYVVRNPRRDELARHLKRAGIGTGVHYPVPIHRQPAFAHMGWEPGSFPVTEAQAEEVLSLPMHPHLDQAAVQAVAEAVHEFCDGS